MKIGEAFVQRSRTYLKADYLPRIRRAVGELSQEDLWWRPNHASNSVGNLLLHLAGNIRQWVVSGIGGAQDRRCRDQEFSAFAGSSAIDLLADLEAAVEEVDSVLAALSPKQLLERRVIQGMEVSVLDAIYHVVEHFSTHTGQILYVVKLRTGKDLGFWEVKGGRAVPRW